MGRSMWVPVMCRAERVHCCPVHACGGVLQPQLPGCVVATMQNFLALIPLALLLGDVTEDLAVRFGDTVGGLLNATFGNVVEMILSVAALQQGLYTVVAASLLGSILSNLLLVLGEQPRWMRVLNSCRGCWGCTDTAQHTGTALSTRVLLAKCYRQRFAHRLPPC